MRVDNTADNADITQSQAADHHRLLSSVFFVNDDENDENILNYRRRD